MYVPLVRKWNVLNFDQVIGQSTVVKILKNSLYLDHIFPVYIFAGKHGCGKTSTARLFATAVNCENIINFRKNIDAHVPCYQCVSCKAMKTMQHPDFIEIDAASHTGVDNVRLIIESATLLPLFGNKKIYLIDEAHMLSKAAWNAFLKILEEPPKNVLFILATTAPEKILETVRSRCFQLFFKAINEQELLLYLTKIAKEEKIEHDEDGIRSIIRASGGSVRDALNLLDQARLAVSTINVVSLNSIISAIPEHDIVQLFHAIFSKNVTKLYEVMNSLFVNNQTRVDIFFDRMIEYARALLWFLYEQGSIDNSISLSELQTLAYVKPKDLIELLQELYQHETLIKKIERPYIFLELLLVRFIEQHEINHHTVKIFNTEKTVELVQNIEKKPIIESEKKIIITETQEFDLLTQFIALIEEKKDPLLFSIFKQAVLKNLDREKNILMLAFKKDLSFFSSLLYENKADWEPLLQKIFGKNMILKTEFSIEEIRTVSQEQNTVPMPEIKVTPVKKSEHIVQKTEFKGNMYSKTRFNKLKPIDVSDAKKWPYAHTLQEIFPGVITEIE